jgi:hypothetical protein
MFFIYIYIYIYKEKESSVIYNFIVKLINILEVGNLNFEGMSRKN